MQKLLSNKDECANALVAWFDATEQVTGNWGSKIVYKHPVNEDLVTKTFGKDDEAVFQGFCEALRDLHIPFVCKQKGFSMLYFYKGVFPYIIREAENGN